MQNFFALTHPSGGVWSPIQLVRPLYKSMKKITQIKSLVLQLLSKEAEIMNFIFLGTSCMWFFLLMTGSRDNTRWPEPAQCCICLSESPAPPTCSDHTPHTIKYPRHADLQCTLILILTRAANHPPVLQSRRRLLPFLTNPIFRLLTKHLFSSVYLLNTCLVVS